MSEFKEAIDAGIPMVFLSNLIITNFDENPVSTSKKWSEKLFGHRI